MRSYTKLLGKIRGMMPQGKQPVFVSPIFIGATVPVVLVGIAVVVYFATITDFYILPTNNFTQYTVYTDSVLEGKSEIVSQSVSDSSIVVVFRLNNAIKSPFIGISIALPKDPTRNLSTYNELDLTLKATNLHKLAVAVYATNPLKKNTATDSEVLYQSNINVSSQINTYNISIDHLKIPDWWLDFNGAAENEMPELDFSAVGRINIGNAYVKDFAKELSFEIQAITFTRNNAPLITAVVISALVYILLVFFVLWAIRLLGARAKAVVVSNKVAENREITINYKAVESKEEAHFDNSFIDYINRNFQNSELTLLLVSQQAAVSQRQVATYIKEAFDCNFKTYINRIRITESKRLLAETKLPIGEIAYNVGFNNQTHFNRVFKAETQLSPTEYRDQNTKPRNK